MIANNPDTSLPSISCPSSVNNTGSIPKNGNVAEPGLVGVAPGSGVMRIPPVSVCHHVSTMGQWLFPTISKYQFHSGSLMGSPTVPNNLNEERSRDVTQSFPSFIRARSAVGAV